MANKNSNNNHQHESFQPKTLAQNNKIWALSAELFLSEENLRDVVAQVTKERSISRLSLQQASQVIDLLEGYKRRQKAAEKATREKGKVYLLISPKQKAMINIMAGQIHWKYKDGFQRFLKVRMGLNVIKTNDDVTAVKKALQNIIDCQRKNKDAPHHE